jgi:hypothetical protein
MTTPTQAMFWQIWRGWRWGLLGGGAYMLVAAVVAQVLPGYLRRTPGGEHFLPNAAAQLALPCAFLVIHLAAAFSLTGGDLKERGYWRTMFVRPVRTRALVAWPMLWGSLALAGIWLFVALLIVRPMGHSVPLVWPIAAAAAGLTMLQALSWLPLEQAWLRHVLAVPLMAMLGAGAALAAVLEVPEPIATAAFLALVPLHYAGALCGVAAARRGDAFDWQVWNRFVGWIAAWRKPAEHPFRSARRAQFWFECRAHGWFLPLCTILIVGLMLLVPLAGRSDTQLPWKLLPMVLLMPVLMATMMGPQAGSASFPFLALRPIATATLVRGKIQMALASVLVAYVPVLLGVLLLFTWPGFVDAAFEAARAAGAAKTAAVVLAALVVPVLLTWKGLVESLWLGLLGREWLVNAFAFAAAGLIGCATLFGLWLAFHPEVKPLLWSLVPWGVGLLVILKAIVAATVLRGLVVGVRLVRATTAGLLLAGWAAIVAGLCLFAWWRLPPGIVSPSMVVAAIVLAIPFSRVAGAPLALDWNRHR